MNLVVDISRGLGGLSYGDIGGKLYGRKMRNIVLFSIALAQSGFCCAYYIFVAKNLKDLVMLISNCNLVLPEWFFIIFQVLVFIPLSWVRKLNYFSLPCLIASVFIFLSVAYILFYNVAILYTSGPEKDILLFNSESFHLFIGTSLFSLEGICLILPIADSMKKPEKFNNTLSVCIITILVIFGLIGGTGYLAFGNRVSNIAFLNLPDTYLTSIIQFLYGLSIALSFPITIYPTIQIMETRLFHFSVSGRVSNAVKWKKNLFRAFLMSVLAAVAFFGSAYLDKFTSLVGYYAKSKTEKIKDWLILVFGILSLLFNSVITINDFFEEDNDIQNDRCS
ncbi:neutral amino acid transporter [Clydaea vesicula]|uniref:Neutral amino acid transporter n=1 Tax=Clydaea vesicula TaxID=447962 RepID=A0AAD5U4U8_9FUNG|nr:neutral amino acid transporter [Clydaea vesicula]